MLPLAGVKVLDLSRLLPGPYGSMLLADYGAEVIKVEDPGLGDYLRGVPPLVDGESAYFRGINRNKRSLALNLKAPEGVALLKRLAEQADVFLESFRPGVADRLGIGYAELRALNPRLVYCSVTGYGQTGPMRERSGHDLNYVALAGQLDQIGDGGPPVPDGPRPRPSMPRLQVADMAGAMYAALSIAMALVGRARTGEGAYLDVAMLDAALSWQPFQVMETLTDGRRFPGSLLSGGTWRYDVYWTADGKAVALAALEEKFWEAFCGAVGHPEWLNVEDPWTPGGLGDAVAEVFRTRTRDEWVAWARDKDVCLEPVLSMPETLEQAQVAARGLVGEGFLRSPVPIPGEEVGQRSPAPGLGEHTDAILSELGLSADEIRSLRARGVC